MTIKDVQVQCGAELATLQFTWEKRYLDVASFAPAFLTGRGTMLMHLGSGAWRTAGIAGDNPFAATAGTLGQLTFGPAFSLAAVSAIPTEIPVTVQVVDSDLAGQGSLSVQIVTSQGDAETIVLPEVLPGRFSRNTLTVSSGAVAQGNGILELSNGVQLTLRYVDKNPGNSLPPTMLTQVLRPTGSILFVADTTPDVFAFTPIANVAPSTQVVSSDVSITGINAPAVVSITGGEYAINGGTFTTGAGTISNGQIIKVRLTSSANSGATTTATVTIGGVAAAFTVTTTATVQNAVPNPFNFAPQANVSPAAQVTSANVTISGINIAAPVTISGGQYSVNGGAFTAGAGTIVNGQTLTLRVISSATPGASASTTVVVGGVAATFTVTTATATTNSVPDPFFFTGVSNAALNQAYTSATATITGINVPSPITITGGSYSINGGPFTSAAGTIIAGQTVAVRVQSSAASLTTTSATLTIGGVSGTFLVTTAPVAGNSTPNSFSFPPQTNVAQSTQVISIPVTISGINIPSPVTVVGGQYSINGGAFTAATGNITNGQTLTLSVLSAASPSVTTSVTVNVGGVSASFSVTTASFVPNSTPNPFSYAPLTNVLPSGLLTSAPATITGINIPAPVSIVNGSYSINGGAFTSASGTITNGQTLTLRVFSSGALGSTTSTTVTVGGVSATFSVSTPAVVTTPNAFTFSPQTNVAPGVVVTSNLVTITGINSPAPVSITGGTYSVNGAAYTSAGGTVLNNQPISVRLTSSANTTGAGTATASLNVGGVIGNFTVTTWDTTPNAFAFSNLTTVKIFGTTAAGCILTSANYTTAPVSISGITSPANVTLTPSGANPGATMSINGGPFTAGPTTIANGQTIAVKVNSVASVTGATPVVRATVNIGGVSANVTQTCN